MATAIITGASQGIGEAIAVRLAKDGYDIIINHSHRPESREKAEAVAEKCEIFDVRVLCYAADVSSYSECEKMVDTVKKQFDTIDILVNNAGITRDGLLARMSEENYDAVINTNQKSVFNMMKAVCSVMMKQRSGRVINVTSVAGLYGNAGQFNYSASKAAVIGMTKSAAKEFGSRNITVNAIAPGFIETPMTDKLTDVQKSVILEKISLKRYGQVEEIAGAVSFLASPDANYITGQVIEISGGLSM